ncbi:hypothetical protein MKW92_003987 [Papaver armeniacum]|nr:hypothetical protein MKW92_003987 [Papaver armeniacum]
MEFFVEVIQFLANIPLLQRLPISSFRKIAQLVQPRYYKPNEYVIRQGKMDDGISFSIWKGEAKVHGYNNVEGENCLLELRLKPYDYFGYGDLTSYHQADELSCLVLPHEHTTLLQPKSIWTVDETHETSLMERILHLDPVDALAAASKTVDCGKLVHSFHNYFLLAGDLGEPIIYHVHRLRDGNSFATRRVDAMQKGNVIFTLLASFQKEEIGFEHQEVTMPAAPAPETLLSMEELRDISYLDPRLPENYRSKVVTDPWPVDMRFYEPTTYIVQTKTPGSLSFWLKAQGTLSDDPALHRCVTAYISDLILVAASLKPHAKRGLKTTQAKMWFHRPFRADEWLRNIESPSASSGRGFCSASLVVSLIQEGLIRTAKAQQSVAKSNL